MGIKLKKIVGCGHCFLSPGYAFGRLGLKNRDNSASDLNQYLSTIRSQLFCHCFADNAELMQLFSIL